MGSRFRCRSVILGSISALAAGASFALAAAPAAAQDGGLKELRDRVEAQQREIDDLKSRMAGGGGGSADSGSIADYLKKGIPTKKGTSFIKFYGMLRLDAIWDDSTPSNTQTIGWVKSEDPTATGGVRKNQSDLTIHPRLTRFGFDLDGGKVAAMNDAALTGKVEIDFYNSGLSGQSESRAAIRMRHAYMNFDWGNDALLAGQTSELISPLYPIVNADLAMWGAGNLGDRRPQVRFTHSMAAGGEGKLTLAGMAGLTGAVDNQNLDGDGLRDGEASGYPTLQARAGWSFPWQKAKGEVGIWAHDARETTASNVGSANQHRFDSAAYGFDVNLPLTEALYLKGEGWKGRDLDDVRGGIFQGVNTTTGEEISSQGGWAEVGFKVTKTLTVAAGVSEDNPRASDLAAGGKDKNRVYYIAAHFNWDPVELGIDFMHWHTDFVGQASGLDNRVQVYISYSF